MAVVRASNAMDTDAYVFVFVFVAVCVIHIDFTTAVLST